MKPGCATGAPVGHNLGLYTQLDKMGAIQWAVSGLPPGRAQLQHPMPRFFVLVTALSVHATTAEPLESGGDPRVRMVRRVKGPRPTLRQDPCPSEQGTTIQYLYLM